MAEFFNEASEYHSIEARTEKISYYVQKFRFFFATEGDGCLEADGAVTKTTVGFYKSLLQIPAPIKQSGRSLQPCKII